MFHPSGVFRFLYGGGEGMILSSSPVFKVRGLKLGLRKLLHIMYTAYKGEDWSPWTPPTMEKMCSSLTLQYLHNIIIVHVSPRDVLSSVEEYTFLCKTVVSIIIILEVNVLHDSSPNQTWIGEC